MTALNLGQRYQVQKQLGKQTGRQTVLALDLKTQEFVVIKLLSLGARFDWQDLKLFEREAETLKCLSHPAIPCYLDYLECDRHLALVQTYVEAKSLEQHLKAGRTFAEAEVKALARSLLEILTYLHRQDPPIIHRDLKPSNILLGERSGNSLGRVYLVDFGSVAHLAAREGGTMTVVGTYGYMPPEQFGGRVVPASDLYSLGATLIYLMSGLHPTEIPQKEFRLEFRSLVNLDETFADWLSWMTEPSLDLRLSSAEEALRALERPRAQLRGVLRDRFRSLPPTTRPRGSGVTVRKTGHFIEILFPPRGMGFILIGGLSAIIPIAFYASIEGIFSSEARGVAGVIVLAIALAEFFFCFRRVGWRIDARYFSIVNELFGYRVGCSPTFSREKFDSLFRHAIANSDEPEAVLERLARAMNLQGSVAQLLEEERAWLAAELSDWLYGIRN